MKMKGLLTLAVLLTSPLADAANNSLKDKYYAGLNFGAGWGRGFVMKPSIVFGYHHDTNSKFELEVLSNVKSLKSIGASLLANYRYYPDLDLDPVKLYVSGGLGGYLQVIPFGFGGGADGNGTGGDNKDTTITGGDGAGGTGSDASADVNPIAASNPALANKILSSVSYKLKVGVDYEITPQITGTAGITAGGQLSGIKELEIPDATLEVGIRYNF